MKLCSLIMMCCSLAAAVPSSAATLTQAVFIPERYVLGEVTVSPDEKAERDGSKMENLLKKQAADAKVEVAQLAFYLSGEDKAKGPFLLLETTDGGKEVMFYDADSPERALLLAKLTGYPTSVKELVDAYKDNEVVADEDFKGKPVIFSGKVPEVAKDAMNTPYIFFPSDTYKMEGVQVYLKMDDPLLRKVKRGSEIIVRGAPRGFVLQHVLMDGEIVKIQ